MEQSPKHADAQSKKKKRTVVVAFAIGALALGAAGVYATNSITINGDNTIEFGQGTATTSVCNGSMDSNIAQSWNQSANAGAGDFLVDSVTVSYTEGSCSGKQIFVTLLDSAGDAICGISNAQFDGTLNTTGFTKNATLTCAAGDVARVAITTSN